MQYHAKCRGCFFIENVAKCSFFFWHVRAVYMQCNYSVLCVWRDIWSFVSFTCQNAVIYLVILDVNAVCVE